MAAPAPNGGAFTPRDHAGYRTGHRLLDYVRGRCCVVGATGHTRKGDRHIASSTLSAQLDWRVREGGVRRITLWSVSPFGFMALLPLARPQTRTCRLTDAWDPHPLGVLRRDMVEQAAGRQNCLLPGRVCCLFASW